MIIKSRVPFDTGPLRQFYQSIPTQVLIIHPPLGIADLTTSDIQTNQDKEKQSKLIRDWGWVTSCYK